MIGVSPDPTMLLSSYPFLPGLVNVASVEPISVSSRCRWSCVKTIGTRLAVLRLFMIDTEPIYQLAICERQRRTMAPRSHHVARREVTHAQIELQTTGEMVG